MSADIHTRKGRILSYSERQGLQREINRETAYLGGKLDVEAARNGDFLAGLPERRRLYVESQTTWDTGMADDAAVRGRIRKFQRMLGNGESDSIGASERIAIEGRAKEHEEFFRKNMLSRKATCLSYSDPEFQKAVRLGLAEQTPEFQKRATDWKNIQRQLSPEDATASNLERLRPD
jgi:hypothetical protein